MKSFKKILMCIPVLSLFLSGCSFDDIKDKIMGIFSGQKEEKTGDNTKPSGDTTPSGDQSETLNEVVAKIKPIAASLFSKSESALVGADYATATQSTVADYYYLNTTDLVFGMVMYAVHEDSSETYTALQTRLTSLLPSGAQHDTSKTDQQAGYYVYDVYTVGSYSYVVFSEDYLGMGYVDGMVSVFPTSQYDAFEDYVFDEGGGDDDTGDGYTAYTAIDALAEQLTELLESTVTGYHDDGDYIGLNFGTQTTISEIKGYVTDGYFVLEGFTAEKTTWTSSTFTDNTPYEYMNCSDENVLIRYSVYTVDENSQYDGNYIQIEAYDLAD